MKSWIASVIRMENNEYMQYKLVKKTPILLLDEPCSALDIVCKEKIYEYLSGFIKAGGIVIIATHDIYELSLCDDIYFKFNIFQ